MGIILIAEDSAAHATQIQVLLERAGHTVVVTTDGRQAVESLSRSLPDIQHSSERRPADRACFAARGRVKQSFARRRNGLVISS